MTAQSASMQSLVAMFDTTATSSEAFLNAATSDNKLISAVNLQLWTAFNQFESAEEDYLKALASINSNVEREMKYVLNGNTADSTWIAQAARQASEATAQMSEAVKTLHALRAIYKNL